MTLYSHKNVVIRNVDIDINDKLPVIKKSALALFAAAAAPTAAAAAAAAVYGVFLFVRCLSGGPITISLFSSM